MSNFDLLTLLESNSSPEKKLLNIIAGNRVIELETYLASGSDPNLRVQRQGGNTALHEAARRGFFLCVEKLINYKADPNIQNDFNFTPITLAFRSQHARCVEYLLRVNTELHSLETIWSQLNGARTLWNSSNDNMVKILVKASPDLSRARSNLQQNLIYRCRQGCMYGSLKVMVLAGYVFNAEQLSQFDSNKGEDKTFLDWLKNHKREVQSLQHYCRLVIRRSLHGNCNVMYGAEVLPVPRILKMFICIKDKD